MLLVMCMASPAEVLTGARLLRHTEATPNASRLFRAPVAAGMRPRAVPCMVWAQAGSGTERASLWLGVTVNLVTGRRKGRNSYGTGEVSLRNARRYGRPAPSGVLPFSGVALCHRWDHLTHQPLPAS